MNGVNGVIVMGVSGTGKSTIGRLIADELGGVFVDADDLHSALAVEKMSIGQPLTDADRLPWLDRVAGAIVDAGESGIPVVACSALRLAYRERLRLAAGMLAFVHLHGEHKLIARRTAARTGHFMPTSQLPAQLAALESLQEHELGAAFDIAADPGEIVNRVVHWLRPLAHDRVPPPTQN